MQTLRRLRLLLILILLTGCAAIQTSAELHRGRVALLTGTPATAITHFEQVTAIDGNLRYSQLREGAWTYLGRAYYDAKKYPAARQALERAVALNPDDSFARLYLGLTLARLGDHEAGRKEILLGLHGLHDHLEYIVYNTPVGRFWDPAGQIRNALQVAQRDVKAVNPNLDSLFGRIEGLGGTVEQEIDTARKDESREQNRRSGGD
jgi:tetratricopeptide (TPR) repeat protein